MSEARPSVGQGRVSVPPLELGPAVCAANASEADEPSVPFESAPPGPPRSTARLLGRYYKPAEKALVLTTFELVPFGFWVHYLGVLVESHLLYEVGGRLLETGLGAGLAAVAPYLIIVVGAVVAIGALVLVIALLTVALPFSKPIDKLAKRLDGKIGC